MLNENRQNISTKESLLYCVLGGAVVYFVCALPRIKYYFFPIQNTGGIDFTMFIFSPPDIFLFIISLSITTIFGIYTLNKLNFKNRLVHFSLLGLILSFGGGIITGVLENSSYLFGFGDSDGNIIYQFSENTVIYSIPLGWTPIFFLLLIPFTITFLAATSIIKRFAKRNSLR
jgi:hypothetical protein